MQLSLARRWRWSLVFALIGLLTVLNIFLYQIVFAAKKLEISVLNLGEGSAVLVQGPTGVTMLIDAGPDRSILRELGSVLPFWQRHIDAVVETQPHAKNTGGIPDVFERYDVSNFLTSGVPDTTKMALPISEAVSVEPNLQSVTAKRGTRLDLGGGAYADVLWPDRDPAKFNADAASIVLRIVYGKTSFVYFGGVAPAVKDWIIALDAKVLVDATAIQKEGSEVRTTFRSDGVTVIRE